MVCRIKKYLRTKKLRLFEGESTENSEDFSDLLTIFFLKASPKMSKLISWEWRLNYIFDSTSLLSEFCARFFPYNSPDEHCSDYGFVEASRANGQTDIIQIDTLSRVGSVIRTVTVCIVAKKKKKKIKNQSSRSHFD